MPEDMAIAKRNIVNKDRGVCVNGLVFFTARAYARAVLGVVILSVRPSVRLSVCLSVCHTRGL